MPRRLAAHGGRGLEALAILKDEPERRERLARLVASRQPASRRRGMRRLRSGSQICPSSSGTIGRAMSLAAALQTRGFDVRGVRPPTVPEGTARLRISLTLNVDWRAISALLDALGEELGEGRGDDRRDRRHGYRYRHRQDRFLPPGSLDCSMAIIGSRCKRDSRRDRLSVVRRLSGLPPDRILHERWRLKTPASPHLAAERDGCRPSILRRSRSARGLAVRWSSRAPAVCWSRSTRHSSSFDVFARWHAPLVLCARTSLGTHEPHAAVARSVAPPSYPHCRRRLDRRGASGQRAHLWRHGGGTDRLGRLRPGLTPLTRGPLCGCLCRERFLGATIS